MVLKRNKHVLLLGRARWGGAWRAKAAWVRAFGAASVGKAEAGKQTAAHLV